MRYMNDEYINKVISKQQKREIKNNYIFGLFFGFSTTLIFVFRLLYKRINIISLIDVIFIFYGIFCIVLATINPRFKLLTFIRQKTVKIFNFIGELCLKAILIIIYCIFVIPVGLVIKKKKNTGNILVKSNFVDYNYFNTLDFKKNSKRYSILKIFRLFSNEYFYMLPLIIILLIISILVVLISSSVITPLIYSIF